MQTFRSCNFARFPLPHGPQYYSKLGRSPREQLKLVGPVCICALCSPLISVLYLSVPFFGSLPYVAVMRRLKGGGGISIQSQSHLDEQLGGALRIGNRSELKLFGYKIIIGFFFFALFHSHWWKEGNVFLTYFVFFATLLF